MEGRDRLAVVAAVAAVAQIGVGATRSLAAMGWDSGRIGGGVLLNSMSEFGYDDGGPWRLIGGGGWAMELWNKT